MTSYIIMVREAAHEPDCAECRSNIATGVERALEEIALEGAESKGYRGGGDHHVRLRVNVDRW